MKSPWQQVVDGTRYSLLGIRAAFRNQMAFRLEALALVFVIPAGLWLGDTGVKRALLIGSYLLVLVVEFINSAVEALVDRIGAERHELSGRSKDLGSAAVFGSIILACVVWALVLVFP
jgi:diacylglycerol kinase (ATP)